MGVSTFSRELPAVNRARLVGVRHIMLSLMNQYKYLEMIEIQETYKDCLRIVIAEAGIIENSAEVT